MFPAKDKPHIVHILGSMGSGGAQRMVFQLATHPALQHYRHSVVCLLAGTGEYLERFTQHAIPVHICLIRWPYSTPIPSYRFNKWLRNNLVFLFPFRLAALLRKIDASLVHTHLTHPQLHLQANAIIKQAHLPWIWTIHGMYRSRGEDISCWPQVVKKINHSNAAITAVSTAVLDEFAPDSVPSPEKTFVIYNGIDNAVHNKPLLDKSSLRNKFNFPENALIYGTAGRFIEVKRIDVFIQAASLLINAGSEAHFVIAGDGPLKNRILSDINKRGLGQKIHLLGYKEDMQAFYGLLDVFVLASESESFSLVILEACAMGLPCIATAVGGVPELLADGAGILVPPASVQDLARAMEQMTSPSIRQDYVNRSAEVAKRFSLQEMCQKYAELYNSLLSQQGP